jgi:hypothetical protein
MPKSIFDTWAAPFNFRFLKNLKPHISVPLKIMVLNIWIDMYSMGVCKKISLKSTLYFGKYIKKRQICDSKW